MSKEKDAPSIFIIFAYSQRRTTTKCQTMLMWNERPLCARARTFHSRSYMFVFFFSLTLTHIDFPIRRKRGKLVQDNVCKCRQAMLWNGMTRIEGYNVSGQTCLNNGYHTFTASLHQHLPTNLYNAFAATSNRVYFVHTADFRRVNMHVVFSIFICARFVIQSNRIWYCKNWLLFYKLINWCRSLWFVRELFSGIVFMQLIWFIGQRMPGVLVPETMLFPVLLLLLLPLMTMLLLLL